MSAQERLRRLEELLLERKEERSLSVEALLDLLLGLCSECSNSPLKREKHISDFLNWGKNRTGPDASVQGPDPIIRTTDWRFWFWFWEEVRDGPTGPEPAGPGSWFCW